MWALLAGVVVGVTMGALGGGGAILAVPAFASLLGFSMHDASTGSLVVVLLISLTGVWAHARKGNVRWRSGLVFGVLGLLGSFLGTRLSSGLDGRWLQLGFGLLLAVVALVMVRRVVRGRAEGTGVDDVAWLPLVLAATGVGLLTGFFGVGGGFAIVPALVLLLGLPMRAAVGTSIVVIGVNALSALGFRVLDGGLVGPDWRVVAIFAAAAIAGGQLGGLVSPRSNPRHLQVAFAALLVVLSITMLAQSAVALT